MRGKILMGSVVLLMPLMSLTTSAMHAEEGPGRLTENNRFSLSAQGSVGYLNGQAVETVYEAVGGSRYKLSELKWDLKSVVMGGGVVSLGYRRQAWLNVGLWAPLNQGSGGMDDYDWLLEEQGSPWTDWSQSDADVTAGYLFDINVAVEFARYKQASFRGLLGYKQDYWKWEDHGLRHIYSTDPFSPAGFRNDVAEEDGSTGIIYEQRFQMPYFGAEAVLQQRQLQLAAYLVYSPLVTANDKDQHLYRELVFEENFTGGDYYGFGVRGSYTFRNNVFIAAALDGQVIPEIFGDTTITSGDQQEVNPDTAGIQNSSLMVSLSAGYTF